MLVFSTVNLTSNVFLLDVLSEPVQSLSFNWTGSVAAISTKDKKLHVIDFRAAGPAALAGSVDW